MYINYRIWYPPPPRPAPCSLCAQSEGGTGDGSGEVQALGYLPPYLLIDDLHQASFFRDELVQGVEVQHLLGHDRNPIHRGPCGDITSPIDGIDHPGTSAALAATYKANYSKLSKT